MVSAKRLGGRACAIVGAASVVISVLGLAGGTTAAYAVSCPTGSTAYDVQSDSPQLVQNADDYGASSDTCFSDTGTGGQLTVTQSDNSSNSVDPTSYPSDNYGCTASYCTLGWSTASWQQTNHLKISATLSNSGVSSSDVYDYLLDSLFTYSSDTGTGPPVAAEVEVVLNAKPSYSSAGFCVATSCGASEVTVDGTSWWLTAKTAGSGWGDWIFVRNTPVSSESGLDMTNLFDWANVTSPCNNGCLHGLDLASTWQGSELWPRTAGDGGLGITVNSVSITNEP